MAQSSYGTDLVAGVASAKNNVYPYELCTDYHASESTLPGLQDATGPKVDVDKPLSHRQTDTFIQDRPESPATHTTFFRAASPAARARKRVLPAHQGVGRYYYSHSPGARPASAARPAWFECLSWWVYTQHG